MPTYEFRCLNGHVEEGTYSVEERDHRLWCHTCHKEGLLYVPTFREQAAPGFSVQGFNAKNGYSR